MTKFDVHTLVLMPYRADGSSIDDATTIIEQERDAGRLPRRNNFRFTNGVSQAIDELRRHTHRRIIIVDYLAWGTKTAEVWDLVQRRRFMDKSTLDWRASSYRGYR